MKKTALYFCLFVLLTACQTQNGLHRYVGNEPREPIKPGLTRVSFKNQDIDHWISSRDGQYTKLTCRPLGCPANTVVFYSTTSSTRNPDQTAVLKLAQNLIDETAQKGATVTSNPQLSQYKKYTSVVYSWSNVKDEKTYYGYRKLVFAGGLAISMQGLSMDKAYVQKAVDHFLAMVEIEDGGSLK